MKSSAVVTRSTSFLTEAAHHLLNSARDASFDLLVLSVRLLSGTAPAVDRVALVEAGSFWAVLPNRVTVSSSATVSDSLGLVSRRRNLAMRQ